MDWTLCGGCRTTATVSMIVAVNSGRDWVSQGVQWQIRAASPARHASHELSGQDLPVEGCGKPQRRLGHRNTYSGQRRRLGEQASTSLFDGCGTAVLANGLCPGHCWQRTTAGELQPPGWKPPKPIRITQTERNEAGCMRWQGATNTVGDGIVGGYSASSRLMHWFVLATHRGIAVPGLVGRAAPRFDNRVCVSPEHFTQGTHQENPVGRDRSGRGPAGRRYPSRRRERMMLMPTPRTPWNHLTEAVPKRRPQKGTASLRSDCSQSNRKSVQGRRNTQMHIEIHHER